ncbi:hypothetical protein [Corynebacterium amycolatum]|uniref:hypothetical protein n=1 Tax=Corynebacterium amycolatum TaxID=43765 RepID=UPI00215229AF|nr:hypothetical protein [Corynebacterium amycolatum]
MAVSTGLKPRRAIIVVPPETITIKNEPGGGHHAQTTAVGVAFAIDDHATTSGDKEHLRAMSGEKCHGTRQE